MMDDFDMEVDEADRQGGAQGGDLRRPRPAASTAPSSAISSRSRRTRRARRRPPPPQRQVEVPVRVGRVARPQGAAAAPKGAKAAPKSPSGADLVDVQDTFLTIGTEQPRATSETQVRILSFENTIKLSSRLEAESAVRLVETYDQAASDYMDLKLPLTSSPASYKRSVLVSYLDDEMMVVRDALGRPDVLVRIDALEEKGAPSSLGGEDTNTDEEAPGAS